MSKASKATSKIFSFNHKDQLSTLELWQTHLQALRRASQEPHNLSANGDVKAVNEISTSQITIRPRP